MHVCMRFMFLFVSDWFVGTGSDACQGHTDTYFPFVRSIAKWHVVLDAESKQKMFFFGRKTVACRDANQADLPVE